MKAKAKLYTSLVRAKIAAGGREALARMTPIPDDVAEVIDPAFTIGLGALNEHEERGLQCPVRGCGVWRHSLSSHLNKTHVDIGGADAVRNLLSIPRSVRLVSSSLREKHRRNLQARIDAGTMQAGLAALGPDAVNKARLARARAGASRQQQVTVRSMNFRNLRNQCEAQIGHKLIDLHHKLGRSPAFREALAEYGRAFVTACCRLYGSWNNAKQQVGLEGFSRGQQVGRDKVLSALAAYHEVHGKLPTVREARCPSRTPLIPTDSTIRKRLHAATYEEAMEIAAAALGISLSRRPQRLAA